MKIKYISSLLLLLVINALNAQEDEHDHDHESEHKEEHHHAHEVGISNAPVYFIKAKEFSYALHLHYTYNFPESKFGIGLGYEQVFDNHKHKTFGVIGKYMPIERLSLIASPGVLFEQNDFSEAHFALHIEAAYEFAIGDVHLGPALEFAYDPEDIILV